MKLITATIIAACLALTACASAPEQATEQGSVIQTNKDGSKIENRSDYAEYANVKLKLADRPLFEMTCPPQGCVVASLKVNNPTSGADLAAPAKPVPEPSGFDKALAAADRLLTLGLQGYGIAKGAAVQIAGINASKETAQSRDRTTVDLVDRITAANAQATGFITRPNITNNNTNNSAGRDLNTGGAQSNDNSLVTNNCGSGNPGSGGSASTTSPPPATGSQANAGSSGASGGVECRR